MSILWRKLGRDIGVRRAQFIAIAITSFLGIALFEGSYDAYRDLVASYDAMFVQTRFADVVVAGGDSGAVARDAAGLDGVAATQVRRVADVPMRVSGRTLFGRVVEIPAARQPSVDAAVLLSGHGYPLAADEVLVEQHTASQFALREGSLLEVAGTAGWTTVRVAGVVASAEYLWPARSRQDLFVPPGDFGVVFAPRAVMSSLPTTAIVPQALVLFDLPSAGHDALTARVERIARSYGATDVLTKAEQPSNAALHEDLSGFGEMSLLFPILFLGASVLAMSTLLGRMVRLQRTQIGLLLASGFARRTVFAHYVTYGLAASLAGGIPGAIAGAALGAEIVGEYAKELSIPVRVVSAHPLTVVLGLLFAALAGALAGLVPAVSAARLAPAEAMRAFAPATGGGASLIERVIPPLARLPARWRLVLRGLGRNRWRSGSTIIGVALAITLILVSWGMLDTTQLLLDKQFVRIQREDADLFFAGPVPAERIDALRGVEGVAAAEPLSRSSVAVGSNGRSYGTTLIAFVPGTSMHGFLAPDGHAEELPTEGVLLGQALRGKLGIHEGQTVELTLPAVGSTLRERVSGFVDEPMGTFAYMSLPRLAADLGVTQTSVTNGAAVRYDRGEDPSAMRDRLEASGPAGFVDGRALARFVDQYMGLFYAFVGVMLVLGGIMAAAIMFTTMSVNVSERSSEIATLRANGMTRAGVSRLLASENLLLTAIGIPPGLIVGYAASWIFMHTFSSDLFSFDLTVRPTTFLLTALAVVAVAALSQRPALRVVGTIDIGREIRVLSA